MSNQPKRGVAFLWSVVALALVALCAPPAQAGHSGHHSPRIGAHHQPAKKHAKPVPAPSAPTKSK